MKLIYMTILTAPSKKPAHLSKGRSNFIRKKFSLEQPIRSFYNLADFKAKAPNKTVRPSHHIKPCQKLLPFHVYHFLFLKSPGPFGSAASSGMVCHKILRLFARHTFKKNLNLQCRVQGRHRF